MDTRKLTRRGFCTVSAAMWMAAALTLVSPSRADEELYTVELTAKGGRFYPETLNVPAGRRFKIVLRNEGPEAEEFEGVDFTKEKVLAPGSSSFLVFAPLKPGVYRFIGEFHPETAKGQIVAK